MTIWMWTAGYSSSSTPARFFIAQRFTDYVGGFRISCQYFNNHADIDAMAAAMKELIQEIGRAPDYKAP